MVFQIFQLILALAIIICAMSNTTHFKTPYVLWMELLLLLTMAIDLFVIRFISEGGFGPLTKGIMGKIDLVVFAIFALTLLFLALNTDE